MTVNGDHERAGFRYGDAGVRERLLAEVVAEIRAMDRGDVPDAEFRSAALAVIREKVTPEGPGWPALPAGSLPEDAAKVIAVALINDPAPAVGLFSRLAGTRITVKVTSETDDLRVSVSEAEELGATPRERAYEREALLMAGSVPVARARLFLVRSHVPAEAWEAITGGEPAGEVLGAVPWRMRRVSRRAFVSPTASAAVDASARLLIRLRDRDVLAGTSAEHVTTAFCRHVAALAG